jgi:hypothetical protein
LLRIVLAFEGVVLAFEGVVLALEGVVLALEVSSWPWRCRLPWQASSSEAEAGSFPAS